MELVGWFDDEFEAEQLILEEEMLFDAQHLHHWAGRDFYCCYHPPEVVTRVFHVYEDINRVEFGWFINKKFNNASCTVEQFKQDFTLINKKENNNVPKTNGLRKSGRRPGIALHSSRKSCV